MGFKDSKLLNRYCVDCRSISKIVELYRKSPHLINSAVLLDTKVYTTPQYENHCSRCCKSCNTETLILVLLDQFRRGLSGYRLVLLNQVLWSRFCRITTIIRYVNVVERSTDSYKWTCTPSLTHAQIYSTPPRLGESPDFFFWVMFKLYLNFIMWQLNMMKKKTQRKYGVFWITYINLLKTEQATHKLLIASA